MTDIERSTKLQVEHKMAPRIKSPIPMVGILPGAFQREFDVSTMKSVPSHQVLVDHPFYISTTVVSQQQWMRVMGTEPWGEERETYSESDKPAVCISATDASTFCDRLTELEHRKGTSSGWTFRLPSIDEWEYVLRSGTSTDYWFGDVTSHVSEFAVLDQDQTNRHSLYIHGRTPNPWGVYDMIGLVWEWCMERDYFQVTKGGSYLSKLSDCSISYSGGGSCLRHPENKSGEVGLRVVCVRQ